MSEPDKDLARRLRWRIERDGPLPLDAFWRAAMTDPGHGYYMRGQPIGQAGDFTTAPEISQIFGELVGLWLVEAWLAAGRPAPFALVELGPGRGQLMADALRAAAVAPDFVRAARLVLAEASPSLRQAQAERLQRFAPVWRQDWQGALEAADDLPLFLIANEFLDALPILQLERTGDGWRERRVGLGAGGGFAFAAGPPATPCAFAAPAEIAAAPEGAILEVSPERQALAEAIGRHVAAHDGAALLIDYGHGATRVGDSLQALRDRRPADPLAAPGSADITSHVDFGAVLRAAEQAGARGWGPIGQGAFLLRLGGERRAAALQRDATPEAAAVVAEGFRRLAHPNAMGELFKAAALLPPTRCPPAGFET